MILIGRYDSPYVRRVGVSLHALAISFELLPLSPFSQAPQFRQFSPIGRMPALILTNGEVLIESAAILDYQDRRASAAGRAGSQRTEGRSQPRRNQSGLD
jgi:glutathione S-transferase